MTTGLLCSRCNMSRRALLFLLPVLYHFTPSLGELNCAVKTNRGTGDYALNTEASDGIVFKGSQSKSSLQATECTCGTDDVSSFY